MSTTTTELIISQATSISNLTMQDSPTAAMVPAPPVGTCKLRLLSPVGAEPVEFDYPLSNSTKSNAATEIFETVKFVCEEFSELKFAIEKNVLEHFIPNSYEEMKILCDKYNKVIKDTLQMYKGTSIQIRASKVRPTTELLHHIMQMCYNNSVGDPQRLNKFYEPFSPEVYGETSFKFVQQMINEFHFDENDTFVDLGSGVGQVVLHVAAASKCNRCIGIEKADLPSRYAMEMERKFRFWMNWFGKECSEFELYKGDFFSPEFTQMIQSASFIFVNNFAFGPEVDHRLKAVFHDMGDGARILSSKSFCPLNFRMTARSLHDTCAILKVKEILPNDMQSVSWTGKPVSYFLHTIDRRDMEQYYFDNVHRTQKSTQNAHDRKPNNKGTKKYISSQGSSGSSSNSSLKGHDSSPETDKDENIPSKWTRNKWNEYNNKSGTTTASHTNHTAESRANHLTNHSPEKGTTATISNSTATVGQIVKKKNSRGRPRKNPATAEMVVAVTANKVKVELPDESSSISLLEQKMKSESVEQSEEQPQRQQEVSESQSVRRRGRPRKAQKKGTMKRSKSVKGVCLTNLELLHKMTLESIDVDIDPRRPPPGCVEQKLCSNESTSVPNVVVTNEELIATDRHNIPLLSPTLSSYSASPVDNPNGVPIIKFPTLDALSLYVQHLQLKFIQKRKPEYALTLMDKIKHEEKRRNDYRCKENELKRRIYEEKQFALSLIKEILAKSNIHSYSEFVDKFNAEVKKNDHLKTENMKMEQKIRELSLENQALEAQVKVADDYRRRQLEEERAAAAAAEAAEARRKAAQEAVDAAAAAAVAVVTENGVFDVSPMHSPKPNYKELKFKKYQKLTNQENAAKASNSKSNGELPPNQVSSDQCRPTDNSLQTTLKHGPYKMHGDSIAGLLNGVGSERMPQNSPNRMEGLFHKAFENPGKIESGSTPIAQSLTEANCNTASSLTNGHIMIQGTAKTATQKTTQRRSRKRVETITTKKDRTLIMSSSAGGYLTMQLVRSYPPSTTTSCKETNIDSTIDSVVNNCIKMENEKPAIKMKINAKAHTTVLLNDEPEYSSNNNKRKPAGEESYSVKRRGSEKKESRGAAAAAAAAENSSEPKLPPVVLKLAVTSSNNGPNYELKNVDNSESASVSSKKPPSYRAAQSGDSPKPCNASSSNTTAKTSDYNASPSYVPPLKLSTAQHYRSTTNLSQDELHLNQSKESSTQSPCVSPFTSSRSSSVDSSTAINNNTAAAKKTRKTRSSASKKTVAAPPASDFSATPPEGLLYQSQQNVLAAHQQTPPPPPPPQPPPPSSSSTSDNSFMSNYSNALNLMNNFTDSTKNLFNNNNSNNHHHYFANNQPKFDPAHFWSKTAKSTPEPPPMVHHRKMKDHSKMSHYYDEVNTSSMQYQQYQRQLSSCMMDKGGNLPESLNHQTAAMPFQGSCFDYPINCRGYDNSTAAPYLSNGQHHVSQSNLEALLKKPKADSQVAGAHTANGYYNQNAIF